MPASAESSVPPGDGVRAAGFTLVELLVVMAVLSLLVVMFTQLMNGAALGVNQGTRRIEEDTEARLVLDRLASDFAGMLRRDDVDYSFVRQAGDDFLSFYTQTEPGKPASASGVPTPVPGVQRTTALVGVRINTNTSSLDYGRLERAAVDLSSNGLTFAPTQNGVYAPSFTQPNSLPVITDAEYHLLGRGVFRFEICFLYKDPNSGAVTLLATLPPSTARSGIQALVVAVAVLDATSRRTITTAQLAELHTALADYTDQNASGNRDIAAVWGDAVNSSTFVTDLPLPIRQGVKVYQRYYPLQ